MTTQKHCRSCGQPKDGGRCRPCRLASQRRWRLKHREELRRRARGRYQSVSVVRQQSKRRNYKWREANREKYLLKKRAESARYHERKRQNLDVL